ncbi:ankyrin repeat protein, putative [Trichomonas vaginalis G3]|uniref:Ankyrin repeat protein, putative n=1 Tax=Trichomonas vaginalis (strain ATCC PRA-98 / G3) TaxID=412133 RepID=A2DTD6_TRIV3|nr:spectrin binding [Trichomonas vaginalis G3]EAY16408.1 ankyrin repeat protein, putative [Trichomonas vaginalis G3]KAI5488364.1 spectrin binding [Trichomonas vaginalis G3]|eukprot:XP_001328631.1 ankyrin repeat protein [Trichomonas vaginalis G3]
MRSDFYITSYSLLELCCYYGAIKYFKFLRTKFKTDITRTCLNYSFLGGNAEIINECLKAVSPGGYAHACALMTHNIDFVTYLMNEHDIIPKPYYCGLYCNTQSLFIYLAETKDIYECIKYSPIFGIPSLCEYLLSHWPDVEMKSGEHQGSALHKAAEYHYTEILDIFVRHGADIDIKDFDNQTPLHISVKESDLESIKFLVSHGADVNAEDNHGNSPLHAAANGRNKMIAMLFISHGADVNAKDDEGITPLHCAAKSNRKEIAEILISHGADINAKDYKGNTPLHYAAESNGKEIAEILISHGANVNEKDDAGGRTPLHKAMLKGGIDLLEFLISHGADVNAKDHNGETPLHDAAYISNTDVVKFLVSHPIFRPKLTIFSFLFEI